MSIQISSLLYHLNINKITNVACNLLFDYVFIAPIITNQLIMLKRYLLMMSLRDW